MHAIFVITFLDKKTKGANMRVKNIEAFLKKKKTQSVNMLASDIEIFLKDFIYYESTKFNFHLRSLVFSGEREILLGTMYIN